MATDILRYSKQQQIKVGEAIGLAIAVAVRWVAALVLVVASLGKLTGGHDTFVQYSLGPGAGLLWAIGELVLAVWLVSGWQLVAARRVAMMVFGFLAGVSWLMFWEGRATCGCLGVVEVRPVWVTLLDVGLALGLLVANRWHTGHVKTAG